jgi:hypothetical protein
MPIDGRKSSLETSQGTLGTAPYLAKIVGHLDPTFQGGLEVSLIRESGNQLGDENQTYFVKYASPFYGTTSYENMGLNPSSFDDSQKSYGFWGMPPDVGVTGIVIFINGLPANGFWICCIQDKFVNHMVPAIGGTKNYLAEEDYDQGEHPLPVAEHNRKANSLVKSLEIDKIERAVHPIAKRFQTQGLIRDEFRGTSSSTARRDAPNMVFGMSSPGPLDRFGPKRFVGTKQSNALQPVSRLGGTQLVMDDGDDRYFRMMKPTDGPPEYGPPLSGEGDVDIPYNEHFRIRTRTGHQLLFHNSEDLIYIGNSRGTAWIELTSDGKIDIYAEDSISVRTKNDFNFYCDRDFNLEVGRNFNTKVHGEMHTHVLEDQILIVDNDQKLWIKKRVDETIDEEYRLTVSKHVKTTFKDDYTLQVLGRFDGKITKGVSMEMGKGEEPKYAPYEKLSHFLDLEVEDVNGPTPDRVDIKIHKDMRLWITNGKNQDIKVDGYIHTTSGGENHTKAGGNIVEQAPQIHMNGPPATAALDPEDSRKGAKAVPPRQLVTHLLPDLPFPTAAEDPVDLETILRRVPGPEPYAHHENLDPQSFKPLQLDRDLNFRYTPPEQSPSDDLQTPPADWKVYKKPADNPF